MSRIPIEPTLVYDLGCGTGELTNEMGSRWPAAMVVGIDNSEEMLAKTRPLGNVRFMRQNIEDWKPEVAPDLIFSNAALHWVADHETLFPRLLGELVGGGVLAIQMPDNWREPTHEVIYEEVDRRSWSDRLGHLLRNPVARIDQYLEWLTDASEIDAWRTTYYQIMGGPDPVLSWVRGSVLVPVRHELEEDEFRDLEESLAERYRLAYPPRRDGSTALQISRVFLVART